MQRHVVHSLICQEVLRKAAEEGQQIKTELLGWAVTAVLTEIGKCRALTGKQTDLCALRLYVAHAHGDAFGYAGLGLAERQQYLDMIGMAHEAFIAVAIAQLEIDAE